MNSLLLKCGIVATFLVVTAWTHPQSTVAIGTYPLGSYSGGLLDHVNEANLNVQFSIPILNKAGPTLPFKYSLGYSNSVWYPVSVNGTMTWTPVNVQDWGWTASAENVGTGGYVSYTELQNSCLIYQNQYGSYYFYWYDFWNYVYHDSAGGSHPFNVAVTTWHTGAPCGSDSNPNYAIGAATDNSGFTINTSSQSVTGRQGITFNVPFTAGTPSSSSASESNPNGNAISSSVAGQTTSYTDALGMTALTAASTGSPTTQETYTYSSEGNVPQQVTVIYSPYIIRTNFGCTSPQVHEFGPTTENLISEIDMADIATNPSDKYTFTYEQTPGYSGDYTGRLASITLPSGGTISYTYTGGSNGVECTDGSTAKLTRTLSPGGTWTYTRTNVSGSEWKTLLSDPNSNVTTVYFQFVKPFGATAALGYETERDLPGNAKTIVTCYNGHPSPCTNASDTTVVSLPITRKTVSTTIGSGTSEVDTQFDANGYGLPTEVDAYDLGASGSPGPLLRKTLTTYNYNTSCGSIPSGSSIVDRRCTVTVQDGSGTSLASTTNTYDTNGNLTSTVSGLSPSQQTKGFSYNSNGTIATATGVNNQVTTYSYNGTYGCSSAFPTSVTGPTGLTVSAKWDCYAGLATSFTDPNGKSTSFGYDNMNRLVSTGYPDGGSVTTTFSPTTVQSTTKITSGISRTDTLEYDGQGRVSAQIIAGVETDKTYDSLGRLYTASVKNSGQQDTYSYDALSRLIKITHADNSYFQKSYSNSCTTVTDESAKVHEVCVDGVGRTSEVIEDPSGLNYTTNYAYDALDNLLGVVQGSTQTCQIGSTWYARCFLYDSLRRVKQAVTPESGTVTYTYDSDSTCGTSMGDLVKRVDARGRRTCYGYDSLHRLVSNTYSDSTPAVTYYYDQATYNGLSITNGLTKRTGMSDGSGATAWSFDAMGRVLAQEETISGTTKTLHYTYNYDGSTASITYPSGRAVKYGVDSIGRPATAADTANNINYVTGSCSGGACYAPQDALASLVNGKTGTFAGITYSVAYNNRLEPSSMSASSTAGTALSLTYGYYSNGSVETITNNLDTGRNVTYGYDSLNRINTASSQATSGPDCWGQSVPTGGYDRFGNLQTLNVSKCSAPSLSVGINTKNEITNAGFAYDASGDETGDGSYSYTWDAERRMTSGAGVTYTFDGTGKRVKDSSPKLYWYGLNGSVLAETDASGNNLNEYIFFNGMRIARRDSSGNVYYYFGNALGSAAITTATGSRCYDADFYPFGGELVFTNSCAQNYKFAAMERDPASGLYRTMNRQYSSGYSRWLSPDPLGVGAVSLENPQTWNMYAYVRNNPTTLIDPLGLEDVSSGNPNCEDDDASCDDGGGDGSGGDGGDGSGGDGSGGGSDGSSGSSGPSTPQSNPDDPPPPGYSPTGTDSNGNIIYQNSDGDIYVGLPQTSTDTTSLMAQGVFEDSGLYVMTTEQHNALCTDLDNGFELNNAIVVGTLVTGVPEAGIPAAVIGLAEHWIAKYGYDCK